jgi:CelD/BcsL family acetyltransferase involved in cellulose biosynthesis
MRRITEPDELREHFPAFVAMHTAQWRADGLPGHFGDWPGSLAFAEDLVRELAPAGRVVLSCLLAGDRPVSYFWDFRYGATAHWRLPARETAEEEMEKLGLGRVGLIQRIETLIPEGIRTVEDGPGHYEYKLQHGAEEHPLRSILVVRSSPYARAAMRVAIAVSDGIHFAYYRGWRRRGLGLLGLRPGSLWRIWIRTRF